MAQRGGAAYLRTMATSDWLCCFCGEEIEERAPDPCHLSVKTAGGMDQWWACHGKCFKERLSVDPIFEPVIF